MTTTFEINGRKVTIKAPDDSPLLWAIRDEVGLTGSKFGCGIGACGTCTVHLNGEAVRSCVTPVNAAAGAKVTTIEGLAPKGAHPLQVAWIKAQAYRLHTFGTVTRLANGGELGAESSVTKVFWSDLDVALHQTALDLRGADAELYDHWTEGLLFALGGPIYAGTNEIQLNIISERGLGMPRG